MRGEAGRILENALQRGGIPLADKSYLAQVVASRTGVSQNEAEKRVSAAFESIQEAADTARKAVAHSLLWGFLALLIGAFCASFAATIGGRQTGSGRVGLVGATGTGLFPCGFRGA